MSNIKKEVQTKLAKGLLDLIVLQFLDNQPMHGYQIITNIRKASASTSDQAQSTRYSPHSKKKAT